MFGRIIFGESVFGRASEDEAILDGYDLPYSSLDFLPVGLQNDDLYVGLSQVLDYVLGKYHHKEMKKIASLYNAFDVDFSPDQIISLLGGARFFVKEMNDDQKRSLVLMLSNLYEVKGLRKGIEGVLGLIGFPALVYEAWEVADEVETGRPRQISRWNRFTQREETLPPVFSSAIWEDKIKPCNIAIAFDITGKVVLDGIDVEIRRVIESLLWVCTKIQEYVWIMNFSGPGREDQAFLPSDEFSIEEELRLCSKFTFQDEQDFCVLNRPIIESTETLNEDMVLAIFTEKALEEDVSWRFPWEDPLFKGFLYVDWSSASSPYSTRWENDKWIADVDFDWATLFYVRSTGQVPPPPLFYSVGKNESLLNQDLLTGSYKASFTVSSAYPVVLQVIFFAEEEGVTPTLEEILACDVKTPQDIPQLGMLTVNTGNPDLANVIYSTAVFSLPAGDSVIELDTLVVAGHPLTLVFFASNPTGYGVTSLVIKSPEIIKYSFDNLIFSDHFGYIPFLEYFDTPPLPARFIEDVGNKLDQSNSSMTLPIPDLITGQKMIAAFYPAIPELDSPYLYLTDVINNTNGTSTFKLSVTEDGPPVDFSSSEVQLLPTHSIDFLFIDRSPSQIGIANERQVGWNPFSVPRLNGLEVSEYFQIINNGGNQEALLKLGPRRESLNYVLTQTFPSTEFLSTEGTPFFGAIKFSCEVEVLQGTGQIQFSSTQVKDTMVLQEAQAQGCVWRLDEPGIFLLELPDPGYLAIWSRLINLGFISDYSTQVLDATDSFFWNAATNTINTPEHLEDDMEVVLGFSEGKVPSGVLEDKNYFVVNSSWDGNNTELQLSETEGGSPINFGEAEAGVSFYLYALLKVIIRDLEVKSDPNAFFAGEFSFEENTIGSPSDPDYWEVNDESNFWQVACAEEEECCPEEITEETFPINLGYDEIEATLSHGVGDIIDLSEWDMEVETSEVEFDSILDYTGSPDSSLIPVGFNWAVGTQVRLRLLRDTEDAVLDGYALPNATGHTFDEDNVYYVIPFDNPSEGVWTIKLAVSYDDAQNDIFILFDSNSGTDKFLIDGSQLPPEYRENLP